MVPKFQVTTACFSCSPPDLNSSELLPCRGDRQIISTYTDQKIKIPLFLSQASISYHSNVVTLILALLGRSGTAWEPSKK
jgi:hypothetical protein